MRSTVVAVGGFAPGNHVPVAVIVLVVVVLGLTAVLWSIRRDRSRQDLSADRVYLDVITGFGLLEARLVALAAAVRGPYGSPVASSAAPEAAAALADAQDRYDEARRLRALSPGMAVSKRCRWVLAEGLIAAYAGERRLGRRPGPPPPLPTNAPLVEAPVRVVVGDATHVALPAYAPGFRFCYSGGLFDVAEVPGGWYAEPFWERLLATGTADRTG